MDMGWTAGPAAETVEKITDKYQDGDFDGMTDSYSDRGHVWPEVFGGAKYVQTSRGVRAESYNKTASEMGYPNARMNDQTGQMDDVSREISDMIKRETWKRAF